MKQLREEVEIVQEQRPFSFKETTRVSPLLGHGRSTPPDETGFLAAYIEYGQRIFTRWWFRLTRGEILRDLIRTGVQQDHHGFRRAVEVLIAQERAKQHHLLANELEKILHMGNGSSRMSLASAEVPKDSERGLPLLEVNRPRFAFADLALADDVRAVLEQTLLEQSRRELLASYGLKPVNRMLFFGPPGCGKTVTAEALAGEMGLPWVRIRFDGVVSSFLGETSANLRKVFEFLEHGRYVALFDEVDALAKERNDPGEHGELKRVVNALLTMLDSYEGPSILIAATNHENLLDDAFWRRFDEVARFSPPSRHEIARLFSLKLRGVPHELPLDDENFLSSFEGLSHADIERVILRAVKTVVLQGYGRLTRAVLQDAFEREKDRRRCIRQE